MSERRVVVWVQHFADRPYLMLQWHDPETGKRKSKSAETCNPHDAEVKRADLEYQLNHGIYQEPSKTTWSQFREALDRALRAALESLPRHGAKVFRFVTKRGRRIAEGGISYRIAALARKVGVKMTMRTLRRGFGCRYAGKVPAQVLQKLMRHSSIRITMDYYANVDDAVEEAVWGAQRNSSRNTAENATPETARREAEE